MSFKLNAKPCLKETFKFTTCHIQSHTHVYATPEKKPGRERGRVPAERQLPNGQAREIGSWERGREREVGGMEREGERGRWEGWRVGERGRWEGWRVGERGMEREGGGRDGESGREREVGARNNLIAL